MVCNGEQLELICTTNASFLGWMTSIPLDQETTRSYSRYIFAMDETDQESSFGAIDSTLFNASRVSRKDESPLMSRLVIYPVSNGLDGTKVNCTDQIGDAANNTTASTTIIVILSEDSLASKHAESILSLYKLRHNIIIIIHNAIIRLKQEALGLIPGGCQPAVFLFLPAGLHDCTNVDGMKNFVLL